MAKFRISLDSEIDLLTQGELDQSLTKISSWQRDAAAGLKTFDVPRLFGAVSGAAISLGADQTEGQYLGPKTGYYWKIGRISIDGLAATDEVKLYKGPSGGGGRFVTWIAGQPGVYHPGSCALILKPGDYLSIVGTGLTATGQITVTGEGVSAPGEMMWKLL